MSNKSNRPRMSQQEWAYRRGTGGNVGRFYDSRSRFVHVSQWYERVEIPQPSGAVNIEFVPQYRAPGGRPHGSTYKKEVQA